ncbi:MAG: MATE family efflux transporter [Oscillospiraceae bacterium]
MPGRISARATIGAQRSGAKSGLVIGLIIMAVVLVPLYIFAPQIVTLFNKEAEVVEFGGLFIPIVAPFYLMFAINQVYSGALRGAGDTRSTMFIRLGSFVVFRQVYLFAVYKLGGGIDAIVLGYPAGRVYAAYSCSYTITAAAGSKSFRRA